MKWIQIMCIIILKKKESDLNEWIFLHSDSWEGVFNCRPPAFGIIYYY